MIKKILGDITVRGNCNNYIARHLGKTGSSTSTKENAMTHVLARIYGNQTFYFRLVDVKWGRGATETTEIYNAVSDDGKED